MGKSLIEQIIDGDEIRIYEISLEEFKGLCRKHGVEVHYHRDFDEVYCRGPEWAKNSANFYLRNFPRLHEAVLNEFRVQFG